MTNENRIIEVKLTVDGGLWTIEVTKEFEEKHGGGTQVFIGDGGRNIHHALDVARGMVTLSPGSRTDLGAPE